MKTILIAGAGHGGLSAAIHLARQGYDVTVIEKQEREALGYDWHDAFRRNTLHRADLPEGPDELFTPGLHMCYRGPGKRTRVISPNPPGVHNVFVDRKGLLAHLIESAAAEGVRFRFGREVLGAAVDNSRVCGLRVRMTAGEALLPADLVIDAAGMHSPVRASLPESFGIPARIAQKDTFYAWRGYFAVSEPFVSDPPYNVYFYHCGFPGMDWVITHGTYVDILIGGFRPMQHADIEGRLSDFRKEYAHLTDTRIAGGRYETIPLGCFVPLFVADGYAAVGNSACMTEPLSGSGLDISLRAGKMLADTVAQGGTSVQSLWSYNRQVIHSFMEKFYSDVLIKRFLTSLTAEEVDFFLDKRILTEKELGGGHTGYSVLQLLQKGNLLRRPKLLLPLTQTAQRASKLSQLRQMLPQEYDAEAVDNWKKMYESVLG